MMQLPFIDIKSSFADFVESFGGVVTDRTARVNPNQPENPDYIFRNESVIAELKCLEEDLEPKEDFRAKRQDLVAKWLREGTITPALVAEPTIFTKTLPEPCQRDLRDLYGRTIRTHLRKANSQIRQAILDHNMPKANGLLLLANDGNYSLEPQTIFTILQRLLNNDAQYPLVNTVIVFSPNMSVMMPDGDIGPLWMHLWRDKETGIPIEFIKALNDGWAEFHGKILGRPMSVISYLNEEGIDPDNLVDSTKFIKPT